jgi:hypothetical protein
LNARNLVKERRYLQAAGELRARHGATAETEALAAGIAAACYLTAQVTTAANPARLPDGVEAAFNRITEIGIQLGPQIRPGGSRRTLVAGRAGALCECLRDAG